VDNINDPTYPGPDGKMFVFKRNLTPYLAQTKLPKAVYDHVSFASQVLTLPPPYKMRKAKIVGRYDPAGQRRSEGHEQGMDVGSRWHPQEEADL
jgi:hypothetical protein